MKHYTSGLPLDKTNFLQLFGPNSAWTNWYLSPSTDDALAKLASMRAVLDMLNLHDSYPLGERPAPKSCSDAELAVRQIDGTCNDKSDTWMGAAGVRFGRNIPLLVPNQTLDGVIPNPVYANTVNPAAAALPSPREVSRQLFTRTSFKPVPFLNLLAAAWVQFQVHDWFNHTTLPDVNPGHAFDIQLAPDDPLRAQFGDYLNEPVQRPRRADADRAAGGAGGLACRTVQERGDALVGRLAGLRQRRGDGGEPARQGRQRQPVGELTIGSDGLLPALADGFEQTGFRKNWWIGLALLHNLFSKEHNAIVAMLRTSHPELSEQQLFDHARMINAAEYRQDPHRRVDAGDPAQPDVDAGMNANWYGLKKFLSAADQAALPQFFQQLLHRAR